MLKYLLIITILISLTHSETISTNKILKIVDGDTIKIDINNTIRNYRLAGIDTPESFRNAKFKKDVISCNIDKELMHTLGMNAKEYLFKSIYSKKNLTYTIVDVDFRDRPVIYIEYVNKDIIRNGYGVVEDYKNLPREVIYDLYELEKTAIKKKKGIWKYIDSKCM